MTESVAFKSRGFEVIYRQEDGEATGWHYVRRKPGVAVLAVTDDGSILFVKQHRPAIGQELLEIPAGGTEGDASLEQEARRELEEETGYVAGRVTQITELYGSPGYYSERTHLFFAEELRISTQFLTENEIINNLRLVRMTCSEALREIHLGRITDAKTVAAVLLYARQIESRRHEPSERTVIVHERRSRPYRRTNETRHKGRKFVLKFLSIFRLL